MKYQALFSLKDKSKKLKCRLLQFLFGALRVKVYRYTSPSSHRIYKREQLFSLPVPMYVQEELLHYPKWG